MLLADDLIAGSFQPCLAQMQRVYQEYGASVLAVQRVPPEETQTLLVNSATIDPAWGEDETEIQPSDLDEISDEPVPYPSKSPSGRQSSAPSASAPSALPSQSLSTPPSQISI